MQKHIPVEQSSLPTLLPWVPEPVPKRRGDGGERDTGNPPGWLPETVPSFCFYATSRGAIPPPRNARGATLVRMLAGSPVHGRLSRRRGVKSKIHCNLGLSRHIDRRSSCTRSPVSANTSAVLVRILLGAVRAAAMRFQLNTKPNIPELPRASCPYLRSVPANAPPGFAKGGPPKFPQQNMTNHNAPMQGDTSAHTKIRTTLLAA